jgi:nicotinamide riboside kinase
MFTFIQLKEKVNKDVFKKLIQYWLHESLPPFYSIQKKTYSRRIEKNNLALQPLISEKKNLFTITINRRNILQI